MIGLDRPSYNTNYNNNNNSNNSYDGNFYDKQVEQISPNYDNFRNFTGEMLTSTPMKLRSPNDLTKRIRNLALINQRIKNISYKDANVVNGSWVIE